MKMRASVLLSILLITPSMSFAMGKARPALPDGYQECTGPRLTVTVLERDKQNPGHVKIRFESQENGKNNTEEFSAWPGYGYSRTFESEVDSYDLTPSLTFEVFSDLFVMHERGAYPKSCVIYQDQIKFISPCDRYVGPTAFCTDSKGNRIIPPTPSAPFTSTWK